ncbi:MAG: hypothetical protein QXJ18_00015 [Desulfurococcaceae archaeon]
MSSGKTRRIYPRLLDYYFEYDVLASSVTRLLLVLGTLLYFASGIVLFASSGSPTVEIAGMIALYTIAVLLLVAVSLIIPVGSDKQRGTVRRAKAVATKTARTRFFSAVILLAVSLLCYVFLCFVL